MCIASSTELVWPVDERSLNLLKEKHLPMHLDSSFPAAPTVSADPLGVSSSEVIKVVYSFPAGSAGGPDGLCPQHLKDLVIYARSEGSDDLIASLTNFVNYVIAGNVRYCR